MKTLSRRRPASLRPGMSRQEQNMLLQELFARMNNEPQDTHDTGVEEPTSLPLHEVSLLSRTSLDRTVPQAKAWLAIGCWINSFAASGVCFAQLEMMVRLYHHPGVTMGLPWRGFLVGFGVQLALTALQIYTAERNRTGYMLSLVPDALMTAIQWSQWIVWPVCLAVFSILFGTTVGHWSAIAACIAIGTIVGVYSAQLPERLVFGKRRR